MARQKLGALVLSPHARGTAPLVIAMGQREDRAPKELFVWGARDWPEGPLATRILPFEIPAQEAL